MSRELLEYSVKGISKATRRRWWTLRTTAAQPVQVEQLDPTVPYCCSVILADLPRCQRRTALGATNR